MRNMPRSKRHSAGLLAVSRDARWCIPPPKFGGKKIWAQPFRSQNLAVKPKGIASNWELFVKDFFQNNQGKPQKKFLH